MQTRKLLNGIGWRVSAVMTLLFLLVALVYALAMVVSAFNSGLGLGG